MLIFYKGVPGRLCGARKETCLVTSEIKVITLHIVTQPVPSVCAKVKRKGFFLELRNLPSYTVAYAVR
jgi:hypothetical protein